MEIKRGITGLLCGLGAFACGATTSWILVPAVVGEVNFSQASAFTLYARTLTLAACIAALLIVFAGRRARYILPIGGAFLAGLHAWGLRLPGWERLSSGEFRWEGLHQLPAKILHYGNPGLAVISLGAGLCLMYMLYARGGNARQRKSLEVVFLICVLIFGVLMFRGFAQMSPLPQARVVADPYATSFYTVAKGMESPRRFMTTFIERRDEYPLHASSNMPGKTLIFYFLVRVLGLGPAQTATAIHILAALAVLPLYLLIRRLIDPHIAAGCAVLYFFIPGLTIALPLMNTVTPLFIFSGALMALWWMSPAGAPTALLKGIALGAYIILFMLYEPVPLVLALLLLPRLVKLWRKNPARWTALASLAAGTLALFFLLYWYAGGRYSMLGLLLDTYRRGMAFNVGWGARPYLPHVVGNLGEFAIGAGLAAALLAVAAAARGIKETMITGGGFTTEFFHARQPGAVFATAFAMLVLLLDLSGVNRGEVMRLWIFLMPLLIAAALWFARRLHHEWAVPLLALLLLIDNFLLRFSIPPPGF